MTTLDDEILVLQLLIMQFLNFTYRAFFFFCTVIQQSFIKHYSHAHKLSYYNICQINQYVLSKDHFFFNDRRNSRNRKYSIIICTPTGTASFQFFVRKKRSFIKYILTMKVNLPLFSVKLIKYRFFFLIYVCRWLKERPYIHGIFLSV